MKVTHFHIQLMLAKASFTLNVVAASSYAPTYVCMYWQHSTQHCTWGSSPLVHAPLPTSWPVTPSPEHFPLHSPSSQLLPGSPHKPLRTHCYPESSTLHESAESTSAGLVSQLLLLLPVPGERHHHHRLPTHTEQEQERQQVFTKRRDQWCVATGLPTHTQTTTLHDHSQVYRAKENKDRMSH